VSFQIVLMPLFVQVLLDNGGWWFCCSARRSKALNSRQVRYEQIALGEPAWAACGARACQTPFRNQFELPVLLYVLTILEIVTQHADYIFLILAWVFVSDADSRMHGCM